MSQKTQNASSAHVNKREKTRNASSAHVTKSEKTRNASSARVNMSEKTRNTSSARVNKSEKTRNTSSACVNKSEKTRNASSARVNKSEKTRNASSARVNKSEKTRNTSSARVNKSEKTRNSSSACVNKSEETRNTSCARVNKSEKTRNTSSARVNKSEKTRNTSCARVNKSEKTRNTSSARVNKSEKTRNTSSARVNKTKPKVYQGVRVKMTVKELLQQRRALQAERNASETMNSRMQFSSDLMPSSPEIHSGCQFIPSAPSFQHQTREFPHEISQEETLSFVDHLFLNAYLRPETLTDNLMQNPPLCFAEENIQPAPIFNQSMTPESPSDSSDMSNSFEYSPSYQGTSFVPQSYSSPTYQDPTSCSFVNVNQYCQRQNGSTFCYCQYCCPVAHQETMKVPDPCYFSNTDYMEYIPSSTATEDFFTREISNYDLCYS
ncbi:POU class 2 homeobox associating factor 3 [Pelodytes ibericus]